MIVLKKLIFVVLPCFVSLLLFIFTFLLYNPISPVSQSEHSINQPIVIIDAGHGGFDGGAVASDGTVEKDINLEIAKYLQEYVTFMGFDTIMTRESDNSIEDEGLQSVRERKSSDLHNRMKIMKETENAIFVSIHQNKYSIEKYKGAQVFYSPETKEESSLLAQSIQESIINTIQKDNTRQIKECGTSVFLMYNAVKPAVLVECGFLSNNEELKLLNTPEYQKKLAFCIAIGIQNYVCKG